MYQVYEDFFLYDGENMQDFREQFFFDEDYEDDEEEDEECSEEDEEREDMEALQEVLKEKPELAALILDDCEEDNVETSESCEENEEFKVEEDEGFIHDNEDC